MQKAKNAKAPEKDAPIIIPTSVDERIIELEIKLVRNKNTTRFARVFFTVAGIAAGISLLSTSTSQIKIDDPVLKVLFVIAAAVIGYIEGEFLLGIAYTFFTGSGSPQTLKTELEVLKARKRIQNDLRKGGKENQEYFDRLVEINLGNLAEYYSLVKVHTNNSFSVSVISGVTGFILIIIGLIMGFMLRVSSDSGAEIIGYLTSGAGIVTEFISAIFFYLYNQTIRQLKEYHDSLLAVQNLLLSFKLVGDIKDEERKSIMIGQMLSFLVGQQPSLITATKIDVENK